MHLSVICWFCYLFYSFFVVYHRCCCQCANKHLLSVERVDGILCKSYLIGLWLYVVCFHWIVYIVGCPSYVMRVFLSRNKSDEWPNFTLRGAVYAPLFCGCVLQQNDYFVMTGISVTVFCFGFFFILIYSLSQCDENILMAYRCHWRNICSRILQYCVQSININHNIWMNDGHIEHSNSMVFQDRFWLWSTKCSLHEQFFPL